MLFAVLNQPPITEYDAAFGEEVAGERRARSPFDHLFEATARNHFGMNVDAVLDRDTKNPFVVAVAAQAARDAVSRNDPETERSRRQMVSADKLPTSTAAST